MIRVARHTERLTQVADFYRTVLGFPLAGTFEDHEGYDGIILRVPGEDVEFELTTGGSHAAPDPHPESVLVLYVDQAEIERVRATGAPQAVPANPYWQRNAIAVEDPDGFQVLLTYEGFEASRSSAGG